MDVKKIRQDFPIFRRQINGLPLVYLDSAATSQKPRRVLKALEDFYINHNANIHRGVHTLSVEATRMVDEAREKVAGFIGAKSQELIFVRNATEGINLVAYAYLKNRLKKGEAVIVSLLEHHSNLVPWQEICREVGAELRVIKVDDQGRLVLTNGPVEESEREGLKVKIGPLDKLLDGKVRLVAITAVSNVLGTMTPVYELSHLVRAATPEACILIDGAQLVPHSKTDVMKLKADFLVFSGHKMLGPTGSGGLWGRRDLLEEMKPFLYGGDMISEVTVSGASWASLPHKFEAGTPDIAGIIGLGAAVEYLEKVGMENIREHERKLTAYGMKQMEELEGEGLITIYGPRSVEERGGVITFNVNGVHAHDAAQVLDKFGIAVRSGQHCGAPIVTHFGVMAMARASFYLYNSEEEIDYLTEKIREIPTVFRI
ncbi:SufS family cysteine desulfurase [Candidatus Collierbacteria bacterium]|nr:SufS family cysteine desulfurase [Candidatus Collierbacteria bacterium]